MIVEQASALLDKDLPLISNLANIASLLYRYKKVSWAGFYLAGDEYLYLGPFQGEVACMKINYGKGVVGRCYKERKAIIVDNVHEDKDHIACDAKTNSEMVVPIFKENEVIAIIDLDSYELKAFDEEDKIKVSQIAYLLGQYF